MGILEKVVVIDDDAISNFIAKKAMEKIDLANRIKSIRDPKLALEFLEERCIQKSDGICPELILLDFNFPTTNAIEILEQLHCKGLEIGKHIILIIVSSVEIKEDDKHALLALKVSDFIVKPVTEENLSYVVEKYL
jgi:two-component SAPR family response regulator